jgi:hypothetical protein
MHNIMRGRILITLMFALSLANFDFSESAFFVTVSFTRRLTRVWSKEVSLNDNVLTPASHDALSPESPRRQRRNKYKDFSKVSDHDPLEVLISESKRKNDEIGAKVSSSVRRNHEKPEVSATPAIEYPDVKGIDVSF